MEVDGQKAHQPLTLACSVQAYVQNIDNLGVLAEAVERIAQKHVSLYVLPEQYGVVGENLLWAIKEVLGDAATPEIMAAYTEAYGFLADIFIKREAEIREARKNEVGGWEGWRDFTVAEKIKESSIISSFILRPADGGKLLSHIPGQYVGLLMNIPGHEITTRNYTISCMPGSGFFRITVKKEMGPPNGLVSSFLCDKVNVGDVLKVSVPCGDFVLDESSNKPICFVSGGVGLTPLLSMTEHLLSTNAKRPIYYIDGARNADVEAKHDFFQRMSWKHLNFNVKFIYDTPPTADYPQGPVSIDHVKSVVPHSDCEFYVCGPRGMMTGLVKDLKSWGVPEKQVHFEHFGPHN
eukprot:c7787_g1_i2.p1 GENE.c7787_g1_i2~~c7787_g1_i2.p1  ORF type:complete len:350 (-),score=115.09 c7787_g1_i2:134-1183(-)